ncbi:MAG TPA: hypothetical protein VF950_27980 [Planctomycetota bacterium]
MKTFAAILIVLGLTGCRSWALKDDYQWAVQMPRKSLNRGEALQFRVETRDKSGNPVAEVSFLWSVDWVGLNGSRHKGRSYEPLDIRSKGGSGEAFVRIYAYDADGNVVQVLKEPFQVN